MNSVSVRVEKPKVKSRPIIFHARSIKAILAGEKTMTRRVVTPQPMGPGPSHWYYDEPGRWWTCGNNAGQTWRCPYGSVGEQLWVREAWGIDATGHGGSLSDYRFHIDVGYKADGDVASWEVSRDTYREYDAKFNADDGDSIRYCSPRSMPRWASRLLLEITGVKVERLWQITEADVLSEGIGAEHLEKNRKFFHKNDVPGVTFSEFWDATNGHHKGSAWKDNPWVWVVSFVRVEPA